MAEDDWSASGSDGFVEFWRAGEVVKGEFRCAECRYGVAVYRQLPQCPMCGGDVWEQAGWSPLARAGAAPLASADAALALPEPARAGAGAAL